MTAARLSRAEAQALGLPASKSPAPRPPKPKPKRNRKVEPSRGVYHTRCCTCDERFLTIASETRHMNERKHYRYELVIERNTDGPSDTPRGDAEQDEAAAS